MISFSTPEEERAACAGTLSWIGGNCPVQAEGFVNGEPFYFRARGEDWGFWVGEPWTAEAWSMEREYPGGPYDAGWMPVAEAMAFINEAIAAYRAHLQSEER